MRSETTPWEDLAVRLRSLAGANCVAKTSEHPEQGSLCSVRPDLGKWQEEYYYNPPTVLVLESTSAISDEVLVAQTYHDITLAGPGDLILNRERSPCGECFVESWNTYTLRARDLDPAMAKVDENILKAVKALQEDASAYPGWAIGPEPMGEHDARIYFREMEVEVGYIFASMAAAELIREIDHPYLRLLYSSPSEVVAEIRRKEPGIHWPEEPVSTDQALATARFPQERYPMAAASEERELFKANLVTVRAGRVHGIQPIEGEVFERVQERGGLVIGGRLFTPPEVQIFEVLCFLETRDGDFLSPEIAEWDEIGIFRARFPVASLGDQDLFVAALHEVSNG
jgi:hypothetical protein